VIQLLEYKCPKCGWEGNDDECKVTEIRQEDGEYDGEYIDCPRCGYDLRAVGIIPFVERKPCKYEEQKGRCVMICVDAKR